MADVSPPETEPVTFIPYRTRFWRLIPPAVVLVAAWFLPMPAPTHLFAGELLVIFTIITIANGVGNNGTTILTPDGIEQWSVLLAWPSITVIEVVGGFGSWDVVVHEETRTTTLAAPRASRSLLKPRDARFDTAVAELERWAAEYAPQAEVVRRRRYPVWLPDLVLVGAVVLGLLAHGALHQIGQA
jgi:hypothetical protein